MLVVRNERSRTSSVSIVTRIRSGRLVNRGSILGRKKFFHIIQSGCGISQASSQRVPHNLSRGSGSPLQSSTEVKNAWSYTSNFPYVYVGLYLITHGQNFAFSLLNFEDNIELAMHMLTATA
jgi:hypothetical protein